MDRNALEEHEARFSEVTTIKLQCTIGAPAESLVSTHRKAAKQLTDHMVLTEVYARSLLDTLSAIIGLANISMIIVSIQQSLMISWLEIYSFISEAVRRAMGQFAPPLPNPRSYPLEFKSGTSDLKSTTEPKAGPFDLKSTLSETKSNPTANEMPNTQQPAPSDVKKDIKPCWICGESDHYGVKIKMEQLLDPLEGVLADHPVENSLIDRFLSYEYFEALESRYADYGLSGVIEPANTSMIIVSIQQSLMISWLEFYLDRVVVCSGKAESFMEKRADRTNDSISCHSPDPYSNLCHYFLNSFIYYVYSLQLLPYHFDIVHIGTEFNVLADNLSRLLLVLHGEVH